MRTVFFGLQMPILRGFLLGFLLFVHTVVILPRYDSGLPFTAPCFRLRLPHESAQEDSADTEDDDESDHREPPHS